MKYINNILNYSLFVVLAIMAFTMAINVFCRSILNFSIYWADELALSLMLWLTFLGAALAIREHSHYSFDYLETHTRGIIQKVIAITNKLITLATVCCLLYWSTEVTIGITKWIMPSLEISRVWVYGACPVGCVLMIVYSVTDLVTYIKNLKK